jgi:fatty acid desaturase
MGRASAIQIQTNWWSVMEQSFGFVSGVGVAEAMSRLALGRAVERMQPGLVAWAQDFRVAFLLLVVTCVSIGANLSGVWQNGIVPALVYAIPADWWWNLASALEAVPESALGRVQWPSWCLCGGFCSATFRD